MKRREQVLRRVAAIKRQLDSAPIIKGPANGLSAEWVDDIYYLIAVVERGYVMVKRKDTRKRKPS